MMKKLALMGVMALATCAFAVDPLKDMSGLWKLAMTVNGATETQDLLVQKTELWQTNAAEPVPFYSVTGFHSPYLGLTVRQNPGSSTILLTWTLFSPQVGPNTEAVRQYLNIVPSDGNVLTLKDSTGTVVGTLTRRPDLNP